MSTQITTLNDRPAQLIQFDQFRQKHVVTFIAAAGIYVEMVLRLFYNRSIASFDNMGAVFEFLKNVKPLAAIFIVGGIIAAKHIAAPINGCLIRLFLTPTYWLARNEREEIKRRRYLVRLEEAEDKAREKNDEVMRERCAQRRQARSNNYEVKENATMIMLLLILNMIGVRYASFDLAFTPLIHYMALAITFLYAIIPPSDWLDYIAVPDEYLPIPEPISSTSWIRENAIASAQRALEIRNQLDGEPVVRPVPLSRPLRF